MLLEEASPISGEKQTIKHTHYIRMLQLLGQLMVSHIWILCSYTTEYYPIYISKYEAIASQWETSSRKWSHHIIKYQKIFKFQGKVKIPLDYNSGN